MPEIFYYFVELTYRHEGLVKTYTGVFSGPRSGTALNKAMDKLNETITSGYVMSSTVKGLDYHEE